MEKELLLLYKYILDYEFKFRYMFRDKGELVIKLINDENQVGTVYLGGEYKYVNGSQNYNDLFRFYDAKYKCKK